MPQRMTRDLRVWRYEGSYYDLGDCAGDVMVYWDLGAIQRVRATSNLSFLFHSTSLVAGRRLVLVLEQDAAGGRTVTSWPWYVRWPGDTWPTLSTDPRSVDLIEFLCTSVVRVYGRLWGRWAVP